MLHLVKIYYNYFYIISKWFRTLQDISTCRDYTSFCIHFPFLTSGKICQYDVAVALSKRNCRHDVTVVLIFCIMLLSKLVMMCWENTFISTYLVSIVFALSKLLYC